MDDPTKLVFTPEQAVLYASGHGHTHWENPDPACPACEFWRRMNGAAAVAQAMQAVRKEHVGGTHRGCPDCAEILRREPVVECGRCAWEAAGGASLRKKKRCHGAYPIPGCYYCGTRDDVAVHTCEALRPKPSAHKYPDWSCHPGCIHDRREPPK